MHETAEQAIEIVKAARQNYKRESDTRIALKQDGLKDSLEVLKTLVRIWFLAEPALKFKWT